LFQTDLFAEQLYPNNLQIILETPPPLNAVLAVSVACSHQDLLLKRKKTKIQKCNTCQQLQIGICWWIFWCYTLPSSQNSRVNFGISNYQWLIVHGSLPKENQKGKQQDEVE